MQKHILISKLFCINILDVALGKFELNKNQEIKLKESLDLMDKGFPIDYIIGEVSILNLTLKVSPKTLIPREETEYWLQQFKDKLPLNNSEKTLVDLGTGTGIIGLYLSEFYTKILMLDVDIEALEIAKCNIGLNYKTNCKTILSDGLHNLDLENIGAWDLVANLPYIPLTDLPQAIEFKVKYEPQLAIYSGSDGLDLYRKIINQLGKTINKPQTVLFELDPRNIQVAKFELKKQNYKTEIWLDQNELKRVLFGKLDKNQTLV